MSIVALTIVSCSKDDEPTPEVVGNLPVRIENSGEDGNSTINIAYNANKIVESSSTRNGIVYKTVFTYNGDLIVKQESFDGTASDDKDEYVYENNKLKTWFSEEKYSQSIDKTKREYTYNPDGTILETKFKFENGAYVNKNDTNLFTFVGGNLTKRVNSRISSYISDNGSGPVTNATTSTSTYTYEYDNKNSPLKNIVGLNKIQFDELFSANNFVKETAIFSSTTNGQLDPNQQPARVQDYSLTYNANDYLIENKYSYNSAVQVPNQPVPTPIIKTNIAKYFY